VCTFNDKTKGVKIISINSVVHSDNRDGWADVSQLKHLPLNNTLNIFQWHVIIYPGTYLSVYPFG
jgi:hypothetical protein